MTVSPRAWTATFVVHGADADEIEDEATTLAIGFFGQSALIQIVELEARPEIYETSGRVVRWEATCIARCEPPERNIP